VNAPKAPSAGAAAEGSDKGSPMRFPLWLVVIVLLVVTRVCAADIDDDFRALGVVVQRDAVRVEVGQTKLDGAEVPDNRWERFAPLLLEELKAYPREFVQSLKLDELRVVINLQIDGQPLAAGCVAQPGRIWLDASQSDFDRRVVRRQIATAIWRALPFDTDDRKKFDADWAALNVSGFRYGQVNVRTDRPRTLPGFMREADVSSIDRDQASIFAFVMTDIARVRQRGERDAVLMRKVEAMVRLLLTRSKAFDASYWQAAAERQQRQLDDDREAVMPVTRGYVPAQLAQLASKYGVEIVFTTVPGPARMGDPADADQLKDYAAVLTQELSRYDPTVIRLLELRRVVVVGKFAPAFSGALAITMRDLDTMYFSTEGVDQEDRRCTFHHELFHIIDGVDDGELERDPDWARLNDTGFVYTAGKNGGWQEATPGFVTTYAQTSVGEDKAETYSYMMTRYADMQRRARTDAILAAKMALLQKRLARFEPTMNDAFWGQAARDSVLLKQTYIPGRWVITTTFDIDKEVDQYGRVAEWGGSEQSVLIQHPDGAGNWTMLIKPTRIRHTMRAVGQTMVYDSSDPPEQHDPTLSKLHRFVLEQTFTALVSSDGQVREVRGFEKVLKRAEEEDDTAYTLLRGGKNNVIDAIRYGCLVEVQGLLAPHAVRVGESWKGKTVMSFPPITPFELPCKCTLARIEKNNAVVTVESAFDTVVKSKDDQGVESETKLTGKQAGQFTIDIRNGRVTSSDLKLDAKHKGKPTKVHLTMKCEAEG
jgi:hypothetical protein